MTVTNTERFIVGIALITVWILVILTFVPKTVNTLDPLTFAYWTFTTLITAFLLLVFGMFVCFGIILLFKKIKEAKKDEWKKRKWNFILLGNSCSNSS